MLNELHFLPTSVAKDTSPNDVFIDSSPDLSPGLTDSMKNMKILHTNLEKKLYNFCPMTVLLALLSISFYGWCIGMKRLWMGEMEMRVRGRGGEVEKWR